MIVRKVAIRCTLCREREVGGKEGQSGKESPAGDRSRGVVCERSPVSKMKAANECNIDARQRARGRKERRKLSSMAKETRVEHDVHDTRLTGAMVARVCGVHQGAGATSAVLRRAGTGRRRARKETRTRVRRNIVGYSWKKRLGKRTHRPKRSESRCWYRAWYVNAGRW